MAGTDDANVWVTTNGGSSWNKVSVSLPNRWITRVRFDPADAHVAYVTLSGYRTDSKLPHVFRTTDLGTSWQDISSNLPEAPVNVLLVDPQYTNRLYIGTDVGTYYTTNSGASWSSMGRGLPNVVIDDMQIHAGTRIVRAFTHGRSTWDLHLDELLATDVPPQTQSPVTFQLDQNYPNPFNPTTVVRYQVSVVSDVRLSIFDLLGREVATVVNEVKQPGTYTVPWDASGMASGVYFYRLTTPGFTQMRRMLLVR
jgi:hypothetical protein